MKNLLFINVLILLFASCNNNNKNEIKKETNTEKEEIDTYEERVSDIEKYTKLIYDDSLNFNKEYAKNLVKAYDRFIKHDSYYNVSKEYMFKAGEICKALNRPQDAIMYFNMLLERDPNDKYAPPALFYKAMIIGDVFHEDALAKATYQEFIQKYPDHPLVESAKQSIELQGKSMEEIIDGFKKKEKNV